MTIAGWASLDGPAISDMLLMNLNLGRNVVRYDCELKMIGTEFRSWRRLLQSMMKWFLQSKIEINEYSYPIGPEGSLISHQIVACRLED